MPDLRGLWLAGGFARGFNLSRARLDGGRFERADLAGVHLEGASLRHAHFRHADLTNVRADGTNLSGADLRGATLAHASFRGRDCAAGGVDRHVFRPREPASRRLQRRIDAGGAPVRRRSHAGPLRSRQSEGRALERCDIDGTSLVGADISGAHIYGAFVRRLAIDETTRQDRLFLDLHVVGERNQAPRRKRRGTSLDAIEFVEVDDIQLAQFHNIVDEWGSVGRLLSATTKRVY